jgi:methionyl-tRNA formyltransferase
MRIVFMGTPQFAVVSLQKLLDNRISVSAVVTATDKPAGRGQKIRHPAIKEIALRNEIPILQPNSLKDANFLSKLKKINPDLIVVVAFRILPAEVFTIPPMGTVNLHASLLPKYRGAAPINWALINGETESGVTTFFIQEKVDTGNVISMRAVPISPNMTAGELHDVLALTGADLLIETVNQIENGSVKTFIQDNSLATKAPKIHPEDCMINFDQPAKKVHDFIRGLSPYPAAYTYQRDRQIRLFNTRVCAEDNGRRCGEVISTPDDRCLRISCASGSIEVYEIQIAGKNRMSVEAFLRGHHLRPGTVFDQEKPT